MTTHPLDTVKAYLGHLHASDTEGLIACFEDDGLVHSPFLGTLGAREFFHRLAQASNGSVITVLDLFASVAPQDGGAVRIAAYFRYDWTLSDGREVTFTCVDVFTFDPGSPRIRAMQIVYDTHPLREQVGDKYAPAPPPTTAA
ncbi:nuclear transport factor 2 family protein [Acidovorax sp. SUPP2539]|uniref:nuclear transport factor 2 family protein n=1 Tax=Acidovorax sp. SUPP2539 TaxID=2920878 RepID=UPI0023DE4D04|nr:nuclear transport factor 2 family protein [Acidovorax sp. SUPP2539]GKS92307.1 nuclear transport factor 2 family protein [Acidovorax sp. SUPP2539]